MSREPDADENVIVGEGEGISIGDGDEFDYVLSRPDGGEFEFDAVEIPDLLELFESMQGDG